MHYLNELLVFITGHPTLAYAAIFLVSLSESLALVGLFIPGTVIMFGVGATVATGALGLGPVLLLAMGGAIAGDGFSYWLGRHYHEHLRELWPFSRYPGMLNKGEVFFHRHGGKSVLFGRFVGPVRPVIPVVAGMLGMRPLHFGVVNVLSAIGWALAYILPGVFLGTSLAVVGQISTRLAVLAFLLFATAWAFVWLGRRLALLVSLKGPVVLVSLRNWAATQSRAPESGRWLKRALSALLLRHQGEELFLGFLVALLVLAGWGFLGVMQDVLARDPLVLADQSVYHFFQSLRTPWADSIFTAITEFGDASVNLSLVGVVTVVLLAKRCYRAAGFWVSLSLSGAAVVELLKWLIHLPRPVAIYQGASAFSFPSGHTAMSVILYGFLAIVLAGGRLRRLRWGIFIAVLSISFLIAISRLYLGVHWLSDVLGGFFLGTGLAIVFGLAYLKQPDPGIPRRSLALVAALVVLLAGSWHVSQRHDADLRLYAAAPAIHSLSLQQWLAQGWRTVPPWRIEMAGEQEQPLTLQWAGPVAVLARYLLRAGWQQPPALSLKNSLGLFSPLTPIAQLPVLARLHDGRLDRLRLVRQIGAQRMVLRLWPTDLRITDRKTPLYVGTIELQQRRHLIGLLTTARDSGEYDRSLDTLQGTLRKRFAVLPVKRTSKAIHSIAEQRRLHWQGRGLLVWDPG